MLSQTDRQWRRGLIKRRIRRKIAGTAARPRLFVHRTLKHFYAQVVDDQKGVTLATASTIDAEVKGKLNNGGNIAAASAVGEVLGARLKDKGVTTVVFDRGGRLYHGRVRAAAEAVRKQGIEF
jgi:large subunit ribosomal protein L18